MLTYFAISTVITSAAAIKVWSRAYPIEGSQFSACQYGSVQSERVSSGNFKVVFPTLPPNIQLDSVEFEFNFTLQNPWCHLPTVLIQDPFSLETNQVGIASEVDGHLQIDGLTVKIITNDLILRIPEETPDCVYQLNSAEITLFLPTNVAKNHCQVENVLKILPNEHFELPHGETDSFESMDVERHNDVTTIGPFKITIPSHRMDNLGISTCQYESGQTKKVPSGEFKVVLPPLSSVKYIGWVFRFVLPNPSCLHPEFFIQDILSHEKRPIGEKSRDNSQLKFDGSSDELIVDDLILQIPQETPDCVYEMNSGAITLYFDLKGLGDQCQVGNVLKMVPNEDLELPHGETDSYSMDSLNETNDPPHGETDSYSMDNLKETMAQSDEIINNLHFGKKTVLSMVQELADHNYKFLLNEQPEKGKQRRREVYEMFHRVFDKVQEFATGNLQKPNEALSAITTACESLSSTGVSPKQITVSQFNTTIWIAPNFIVRYQSTRWRRELCKVRLSIYLEADVQARKEFREICIRDIGYCL